MVTCIRHITYRRSVLGGCPICCMNSDRTQSDLSSTSYGMPFESARQNISSELVSSGKKVLSPFLDQCIIRCTIRQRDIYRGKGWSVFEHLSVAFHQKSFHLDESTDIKYKCPFTTQESNPRKKGTRYRTHNIHSCV